MLYAPHNRLEDSARVSGPIVPRFQNIVIPAQQPEDGPHKRIISVQMVTHPKGRHKMYLICNIGLAGGKITYCQSTCMVVYQPTQEKERRREKLVWHKSTQQWHKRIKPHIDAHIHARKFFTNCFDWSALQALFIAIVASCYAPIYAGLQVHKPQDMGLDKVTILWLKT